LLGAEVEEIGKALLSFFHVAGNVLDIQNSTTVERLSATID